MVFPDVLAAFQFYSSSYHVTCSVFIILINIVLLFLLASNKIPQNLLHLNGMMLYSLVVCDIVYEATTTVLMFHVDTCDINNLCTLLYFAYLSLNLCTVFHLIVEIVQKTLMNFTGPSGFRHPYSQPHHSRVFWSVVSWLAAFIFAYFDATNSGGFMDLNSMAFLNRFKAFGYMLFGVIIFSWLVIGLLSHCFGKPCTDKSSELPYLLPNGGEPHLTTAPPDDIVFSCVFMAVFVGWCGWVVLGVDSGILMTIEIMKTFEVTRLAARIMNPLTIVFITVYRC